MDALATAAGLAEAGLAPRILDYPAPQLAHEEVRALISTVQELLNLLKAEADSELGRARQRAESAAEAAEAALSAETAAWQEQVRSRRGVGDDAGLRRRPWQMAGLAVLIVGVGAWVARAAGRPVHP